jgi:hypothetical protein
MQVIPCPIPCAELVDSLGHNFEINPTELLTEINPNPYITKIETELNP